MELYNINAAFTLAKTLYDVSVSASDFEDIAMNAWELINNKHTVLYKFVGDTTNQQLELPCNVDIIESVHIPINDAQMTSNKTVFNSIETLFVEGYIDAWKVMDDPFNQRGKLIKYKEADNVLYFSRDYKDVMVVYHGVVVDEDTGLPMVNDKELRAIATYIAYIALLKEGIRKRDGNTVNLANALKADWLRYCNAARVSEHLSQNDMNSILDVKTRWDRKTFGHSIKPIL